MARDITLQATMAELVGDETWELWLKHSTDAWDLEMTGDVSVDGAMHQNFLLHGLTEGDRYVAQIRLKRAGRYRVGYLTSNPDSWPSGSRCPFIPGALSGIDAPTIADGVWSRTSADHTKTVLTIVPFSADKDLKILRDGVEIGTLTAPFVGDATYEDDDPTAGANHVYTAKHTVGFLDSDASAPFDVFAGPLPPASVVWSSPADQYGKYDLTWSASGNHVRLQDDYLCSTVFADRLAGDGTVTTDGAEGQVLVTEIPPGATQEISFQARVRREVVAFGATDVSDWVEVNVTMESDDPDPDYHSCP